VGLISRPAEFFQRDLKLKFGGQRDGGGIATLKADFAAGKATEGMRHERLAGFGVPFKDVVRAEIQALKVLAAQIDVNGRKPREFLPKIVHQGHASILHASQE
jgi:hypothetical protein